jgi:hypothetical protein
LPQSIELSVVALQELAATMSQNSGPNSEAQIIAVTFFSVFKGNLTAGRLCGFFSVEKKLFRPGSALKKVRHPGTSASCPTPTPRE